jgi:hypothetical protein
LLVNILKLLQDFDFPRLYTPKMRLTKAGRDGVFRYCCEYSHSQLLKPTQGTSKEQQTAAFEYIEKSVVIHPRKHS